MSDSLKVLGSEDREYGRPRSLGQVVRLGVVFLLALGSVIAGSLPAVANHVVSPQVQVSIEVRDDAIKTTMRSTDGHCYFFDMTVDDLSTGKRVKTKQAKKCHQEVTWEISARRGFPYKVLVRASEDRHAYVVVESAQVMPGLGLLPVGNEEAASFAIDGLLTLNDKATWRDRRGGREVFEIKDLFVVGPGVSVKSQVARCIGGDTGAKIEFVAAMVDGKVDLDGSWLFSESNARFGRTCYRSVSERGTIDMRIAPGESVPFDVWAKGGGNWFLAELDFAARS